MSVAAAAQDEAETYMKTRRTFIILGITLIINLVLAVVFRDFIRENVLIPILYLVFYTRLFLKSLGETCLWPLMIILVVLISIRFFYLRKKGHPKVYGYREEPGPVEDGRVAFWMRFIKHKSLGMENLSLVAFRLKELVSSVIAYQENLSQNELEDAVSQGSLRIPGEIQIYLDPKNQVMAVSPHKASLIEQIMGWFRARSVPNQNSANADLRQVVQYLEEQLELEHDDGD
jgi:hypothetical protein